ncbi:PREDICTED: uncharacterized protein LOC104606430 isoform X2 [Nelumbo nucifera]|uniref:Uncharacterized protein LOC104606430 isoform X2 n=1 Tax=Nelumbo nucifera TaxID=4432 RepID=A0A1U8Q7T1_NELNU|nr:PREDICTED: uncharacterized protein LOC104606430 isoform X2 [Nelumbo nucifera]
MGSYKAREHLNKEKLCSSSCDHHPLETPKSPYQAMEFLSRSWSQSATDFFNILSSKNLLLDTDERLDTGVESNSSQGSRDSIWKWLAAGKSVRRVLQRQRSVKNSLGWLVERPLSSFSRRYRTEKKKEEFRLQTAKVHAALSVAELAAVVAGFTAGGGFEQLDIDDFSSKGRIRDKKMGMAIASAATLVATVCAEAAESAGAHKAHIESVVNSALTARTPSDIITLTATAATCLRGTATLKSRSVTSTCFSNYKEMLAKGAQLSVCTFSGQKKLRSVCICIKHKRLILRLEKRYLKGVLTIFKQLPVEAISSCCLKMKSNMMSGDQLPRASC